MPLSEPADRSRRRSCPQRLPSSSAPRGGGRDGDTATRATRPTRSLDEMRPGGEQCPPACCSADGERGVPGPPRCELSVLRQVGDRRRSLAPDGVYEGDAQGGARKRAGWGGAADTREAADTRPADEQEVAGLHGRGDTRTNDVHDAQDSKHLLHAWSCRDGDPVDMRTDPAAHVCCTLHDACSCCNTDGDSYDEDIAETRLREIYYNELRYKECDVTFDTSSEESDGKGSVTGESGPGVAHEARAIASTSRRSAQIAAPRNRTNLFDAVCVSTKTQAVSASEDEDDRTAERHDVTPDVTARDARAPGRADDTTSATATCPSADDHSPLRKLVKKMFQRSMRVTDDVRYDDECTIGDCIAMNGVSSECARILAAYAASRRRYGVADRSLAAETMSPEAYVGEERPPAVTNPLEFTKGIGFMREDAAMLKIGLLKLLWRTDTMLSANRNNSNKYDTADDPARHDREEGGDAEDKEDDNDSDDDVETHGKKACIYRAFLISSLSCIISSIDSLLKLVEFQNDNQAQLVRLMHSSHNLVGFKNLIRIHIGQSINAISDIAAMLQGLVSGGKMDHYSAPTRVNPDVDCTAESDMQMWYRSPTEFVQDTGLFVDSTMDDPVSDSERRPTSRRKSSPCRQRPSATQRHCDTTNSPSGYRGGINATLSYQQESHIEHDRRTTHLHPPPDRSPTRRREQTPIDSTVTKRYDEAQLLYADGMTTSRRIAHLPVCDDTYEFDNRRSSKYRTGENDAVTKSAIGTPNGTHSTKQKERIDPQHGTRAAGTNKMVRSATVDEKLCMKSVVDAMDDKSRRPAGRTKRTTTCDERVKPKQPANALTSNNRASQKSSDAMRAGRVFFCIRLCADPRSLLS